MNPALRVARLFGIDVRVHFSFLIVLLLGALEFGRLHGPRGAMFGALLVLALFACVTLHELGHSLVARRFGGHVQDIILLPIGGVARMLREPTRPIHELWVAVAGPAVNVLIAIGLGVGLGLNVEQLQRGPEGLGLVERLDGRAFLAWLFTFNVSLALFNMIPALPMDGGRVLRAVLAMIVDRARATVWSANIAQVLALGFVFLAFQLQNPILLVIFGFVFLGAGQEKRDARASLLLSDMTAGEVCHPGLEVLSYTDTLGDVVDHALRGNQSVFPVIAGSDVRGVVLRDEAVEAAMRLGLKAHVSAVLRSQLHVCTPDTPLTAVRELLATVALPVVVADGSRLVGVLSREDWMRITQLAARLSGAGIRRPRSVPEPSAPASSP
ncbi:MAG TPA: site-2 protease family protein [Polyangiaceae bacterium]|nr:site-2 protease family protein [Polyangiaceae bacterium]